MNELSIERELERATGRLDRIAGSFESLAGKMNMISSILIANLLKDTSKETITELLESAKEIKSNI